MRADTLSHKWVIIMIMSLYVAYDSQQYSHDACDYNNYTIYREKGTMSWSHDGGSDIIIKK